MKRNLGIAAALLAALVGLEHYGLERSAEKREEDRYTRIADLPASSVLPSYVASLFLGAFRVIVVDALWVQADRMRTKEHRYFETVEIMEFISVLQPRNPEIWSIQAHDAGYSIANPTRDPARKWEWMKTAFRTLDRGIKYLPDNPLLKNEMALMLLIKPTVQNGVFDRWYLSKVEEDGEVQAILQGTPAPERRVTAFELADRFLERASRDMSRVKERDGFRYYTSQSGLNLQHSTLDGFRRQAMSYQGHYLWQQGRPGEAAPWFRKAVTQALYVFDVHHIPVYKDYAALDRQCAELCDVHQAGGEAALPELLARMDAILRTINQLDFGFLQSGAGLVKRRLGGDAQEWNDDPEHSTDLRAGRVYESNLGGGPDVDFYGAYTPAPPEGQPFRPESREIAIRNLSDVPLKLTLLIARNGRHRPEPGPVLAAKQELRFMLPTVEPGYSLVKVEAGAPIPAGADSTYRIAWFAAK